MERWITMLQLQYTRIGVKMFGKWHYYRLRVQDFEMILAQIRLIIYEIYYKKTGENPRSTEDKDAVENITICKTC